MKKVDFFSLLAVLILPGLLFAELNQTSDGTQAESVLRENIKALASLESRLQTIHERHKQVLEGVDFLRIRNRKKGGRRLSGEDFTRFEKVEIVKQDPASLKKLDQMIDRMAREVENQDKSRIETFLQSIDDFLAKFNE